MMDQRHSFHYGEDRVDYEISYKPIKTHRVRIHVLHDGSVNVDAPASAKMTDIRKAVIKKARWIHKHVEEAKKRKSLVSKREYVSGESHYYLGRQYVLKIHLLKSRLEKERVRIGRTSLDVYTRNKSPTHIRFLLDQWYLLRANMVFSKRIEVCVDNIRWIKHMPEWKIRPMKKQWGSCSPKGVISLSPNLIKAPRECIDYVIIHELCHIKEHNHSKKYYQLLVRAIPDWVKIKSRLDDMAELIIREQIRGI